MRVPGLRAAAAAVAAALGIVVTLLDAANFFPASSNILTVAEGTYRSIETAVQAGVDATIVPVPFAWHAVDAPEAASAVR